MSLILPESAPCPFCAYLDGTSDAVFVSRGPKVSVMVNPRQYERGALLVIPSQHAATLLDTTDEVFVNVQLEARRMARTLVDHMGATGVNMFQNAGVHAGQTVPHYHVHVVPRYASSDPGKRFREADHDVAPREQLQQLAARLNEPREAFFESLETTFDREVDRNPRVWQAATALWFLAAIGMLVRLFLSREDNPDSIPFLVTLAAIIAATLAQKAKSRRSLIAGFAISLALFATAFLLTF